MYQFSTQLGSACEKLHEVASNAGTWQCFRSKFPEVSGRCGIRTTSGNGEIKENIDPQTQAVGNCCKLNLKQAALCLQRKRPKSCKCSEALGRWGRWGMMGQIGQMGQMGQGWGTGEFQNQLWMRTQADVILVSRYDGMPLPLITKLDISQVLTTQRRK